MNPLDAVCDRPRTDAICVNQLKNAKVVDKGLLQERPDVKIFLPFKFLFYRPDELFQPHQYNRYLGIYLELILLFFSPTISSSSYGLVIFGQTDCLSRTAVRIKS